VIALDASYGAEDAAVVPVTIRTLLPPDDRREVRRITLVIDNNPAPVAAVIAPGGAIPLDSWSTRIRVDSYTDIHAVAEMSDGTLYVATRFVKAAGGCSAPALTQEADPIPLGTMRFRLFAPAADLSNAAHPGAGPANADPPGAGRSGAWQPDPQRREAQVMIRHPNYSGLQMDQVTRLYIPAHFIRQVRVWQGDALLFSVEGGISLSENPQFRFNYIANGAKTVRAEAVDSDGQVFRQTWGTDAPAM
jgi:sulfur-oxidizing protein SoxY